MNDTQNTTTMEQYNSPERCHKTLASCLQGLDEQCLDISVIIEHLQGIMFFLQEFFCYANLDPNSTNKNERESALVRISYYNYYRNLFEMLREKIHELNNQHEKTEQFLQRATEEFNRITEVRIA